MITDVLPNQFMNWVPTDPETGESGKYPCLPNGKIVNPHDPANWTDRTTAEQSPHGVAFVLSKDDPWFFLDLDKCRNADGAWTPQAEAVYMSFTGAMGEISQSGKGLHILGKCDPSRLEDRKNKWDNWIEFYTWGRFIAFGNTGWEPIGGQFNPEIDWTERLLKIVPERPFLGDLPTGRDPAYTGPEDDDKLIAKMLMSSGGVGVAWGGKATVGQLWNADPVLCQTYPDKHGDLQKFDHSDCDAALMAHLAFWTGRDMPRMERLFRRSNLMRPKFERVDYRNSTVQGAARLCRRVYDRSTTKSEKNPISDPANTAHEVYMNISEMVEHFKGCTYIRDQHRVMTPDGDLLKPEQFKSYYGGHIFQMNPDGTSPEKNAFVAFTENRTYRFPKVTRSVFDPNLPPGEIINDEVNTYFPANVVIEPGDVSRFIDFLTRLLPDQRDRDILLAWMASTVQNPGRKFQWSPVLQGTEGNGKTLVFNCVAYAIGESLTHRPNPKEIGEKHNAWIERSLFILVEEIHMNGRREILDQLKPKITNEHLPIRDMGVTERTARNFSKWAFCTNYQDAVLKSRNDRRYAIFFTAQQTAEHLVRDGMGGTYFSSLYKWMKEGGGYSHVAHFLMNYVIPKELDPAGDCHRAPHTSSTEIAISKSLGQIESEIVEAVEEGRQGFRNGWVSMAALDDLLTEKRLKISRNKRGEMLEDLGYIKCPKLPDGRATRPIVFEGNKRTILFMKPEVVLSDDPQSDYINCQGYIPNRK